MTNKKSRIFVNGCSFSGGSDVIHDKTTGKLIDNKPEYLWPNVLHKLYDPGAKLVNLAIGGNSNDKIVRTTIDYFSKHVQGLPAWVAIIQFSAAHRMELYSEFFHTHVNFCNTENIRENGFYVPEDSVVNLESGKLLSYHMDDGRIQTEADDSKLFQKTVKSADDAVRYLWSFTDIMDRYLKNVYVLQEFMKKKGVLTVFTSMSRATHIPTIKSLSMTDPTLVTNTSTHNLLNLIDTSMWVSRPMTVITGKNIISPEDGHPNEAANRDIAKDFKKLLSSVYKI